MRSDDDEVKTMDGEMPGVSNDTMNRIIGGKFAKANQLPIMVFIGSRLYESFVLLILLLRRPNVCYTLNYSPFT